MTHHPGISLDAQTASAANDAYESIAKLDKSICGVIENSSIASIYVRDKANNPVGWSDLSTGHGLGAEVKGLILLRLYEQRAVHQRRLAQLGFYVPDAPR